VPAPVVTTPAEPASPASSTAAQARRRIRSWIRSNPGHTNLPAAEQWLAKLEANPRGQLHHQALQELFDTQSSPDTTPAVSTPAPGDAIPDAADPAAPQAGVADPLQAADVTEACQLAHQLGWPKGMAKKIADRFGRSKQAIGQRKQQLAKLAAAGKL
jgi:hypothetical protein